MTVTEVPTLPQTVTTLALDMTATANLVAGVKASAIGCSTDQTRPILTNILIIIGDGAIKLVSTNSYMLFVIELGGIDMPVGYTNEFMIKGKQLVNAMPKAKALSQLIIDDNQQALIVHDPINNWHNQLKWQEGAYPQWQNLILHKDQVQPFKVGMNPKWVADIAKAANSFRGKVDAPMILTMAEDQMKPMHFNMSITDRGTFYALLMPVRMP